MGHTSPSVAEATDPAELRFWRFFLRVPLWIFLVAVCSPILLVLGYGPAELQAHGTLILSGSLAFGAFFVGMFALRHYVQPKLRGVRVITVDAETLTISDRKEVESFPLAGVVWYAATSKRDPFTYLLETRPAVILQTPDGQKFACGLTPAEHRRWRDALGTLGVPMRGTFDMAFCWIRGGLGFLGGCVVGSACYVLADRLGSPDVAIALLVVITLDGMMFGFLYALWSWVRESPQPHEAELFRPVVLAIRFAIVALVIVGVRRGIGLDLVPMVTITVLNGSVGYGLGRLLYRGLGKSPAVGDS